MADQPPKVVDLVDGTRTILRALQARMARDLAAGKTVPKGEQRQLVELTERVTRLTPAPPMGAAPPAEPPKASPPARPEKCGARKKGGGTCQRAAGWGTHHLGYGRCKFHGGASHSGDAGIARMRAEDEVYRLGIAVDTDPASAILDALREANGNVEYLRRLVQQPGNTEHLIDYQGKPHTNPVLEFYNEERDRLARYAKLASDMRIDEVRVRLAEAQGRALAEVVDAAVEACNPTAEERAAAIRAAGDRMRQLGAVA